MPFCKTCGTFYTKSLGICPQCNAETLLSEASALASAPVDAPLTLEETKRMRLRRWLGLCIGIIALIGLIYALYYIRMILQS